MDQVTLGHFSQVFQVLYPYINMGPDRLANLRHYQKKARLLESVLSDLLAGFMAGLVTALASTTLLPEHAAIPGLGASGSIAGVMGAYLFLYSKQRIFTLLTLRFSMVFEACFVPIPLTLWVPSWIFLVYRFLQDAILAQLMVEMAQQGFPLMLGVGVFAHLGGALTGLVLIYFFIHPEVLVGRR